MNILITGVGGPTPRSFVRAVKLSDNTIAKKTRFIGVDCNPLAYGLYDKELFDSCHVVPRADSEFYWPSINRIVEKEKIDAAVILPEVEVLEWAENLYKLEKKIATHLPDHKLALSLVNKHLLHKQLTGSEFIPAFKKVNPSGFNYSDITNETGETFWIRSTEGSSGMGSLRIDSEQALRQWISINMDVNEFLATEYLPGRNLACKLLYFKNDLKRTACAERVEYIMAKVAPSGITGNTSFGRLVNEPELVSISESSLAGISKELDTELNGIFTVDFKEDRNGTPKITEINIRHVAFTSSIAAGGANIPLDTVLAMYHQSWHEMKRIDYRYKESLIFLRDVDSLPVIMKESDLFKQESYNEKFSL